MGNPFYWKKSEDGQPIKASKTWETDEYERGKVTAHVTQEKVEEVGRSEIILTRHFIVLTAAMAIVVLFDSSGMLIQ